MKTFNALLLIITFSIITSPARALDAPSALVPAGLFPGDTFYIIFAGSDTLNGAQTAATYVNYAATVKANDPVTDLITGWITLYGHDDSSLVTTSAFSAGTNSPIYNRVGTKIADNRAQLFSNTQAAPIECDESGNCASRNIWTGFNSNGSSTGIGDDSLGGNDSLNDGCLAGDSGATDQNWATSVLLGGAGCAGASLGLYVVSPLLTVPGTPRASSSPGLSW